MTKITAVLINDTHLTKNNGELVKYIFSQVLDFCLENKVTNVILGGDIFTDRSGQPLDVLTDFIEVIEMFRNNGIVLWAIPGNHDKTDSNADRSYLDLYHDGENFTVIKKPQIIKIGKINFSFMPYYKEEVFHKKLRKLISKVDASDFQNIAITHFGFSGVKNNDGTVVESEIKNSILNCFDKVLVGHYHNQSRVGNNIYYTGSGYQNNFGETIKDKGFTVIYENGEIESVRTQFPKFIKKVMNVNDSEKIRTLYEKYKGDKNNFIRFVIKGKKVDCEKINISEYSKAGIEVKFELDETTEAVEYSEGDVVLSHDKSSIMKDFIKFSSEQAIKGSELKYGMNLIKEFV